MLIKKRLYYRGPAPTIEPSHTTRAAAAAAARVTISCRSFNPGS